MRNLDRFHNISDLREGARRRLPRGIFEMIDRGTEDELALAENRAAFEGLKLRTRFLNDLSNLDLGTDLFGKRSNLPFGIGPTGMAGLCSFMGELELAKAARNAGVPFTLATPALTPMETIAREAGGRLWFQLYLWQDKAGSYEMIERARSLEFEALVVTIDSGLGRAREYNDRNGFAFPFRYNTRAFIDMLTHPGWVTRVLLKYMRTHSLVHGNYPERYRRSIVSNPHSRPPKKLENMTWGHVRELRDFWPGKLIVKGVMSGEEALIAIDHGADAVVVSNHGGRSLDSAIAPLRVLPDVAEAVRGRAAVILDSGIRRGSDIVKALALGADFTLIGRATLYGTACAGEAGATKAITLLAGELQRTFGYVGCGTPSQLGPHIFAHDFIQDAIARSAAARTKVQ